jgi:hypothetical protein
MIMGVLTHAEQELRLLGPLEPEFLATDVLRLLRVFSDQHHSGGSAPIVIELFKKLASYEILTPLTGEPDEWIEVSEGVYQNRRCSHVFKEDGGCYDIEGRIFKLPDGTYIQRMPDSRVEITFPYWPKREYVDIAE